MFEKEEKRPNGKEASKRPYASSYTATRYVRPSVPLAKPSGAEAAGRQRSGDCMHLRVRGVREPGTMPSPAALTACAAMLNGWPRKRWRNCSTSLQRRSGEGALTCECGVHEAGTMQSQTALPSCRAQYPSGQRVQSSAVVDPTAFRNVPCLRVVANTSGVA
jgi:hypothetical protein